MPRPQENHRVSAANLCAGLNAVVEPGCHVSAAESAVRWRPSWLRSIAAGTSATPIVRRRQYALVNISRRRVGKKGEASSSTQLACHHQRFLDPLAERFRLSVGLNRSAAIAVCDMILGRPVESLINPPSIRNKDVCLDFRGFQSSKINAASFKEKHTTF